MRLLLRELLADASVTPEGLFRHKTDSSGRDVAECSSEWRICNSATEGVAAAKIDALKS